MCAGLCRFADEESIDFIPPAKTQTLLNDAVGKFIQEYNPIDRVDAVRVLAALVKNPSRMMDCRFTRSLFEHSTLKPHIANLLDVGFFMGVRMLWLCDWDLVQRALFAANPVHGNCHQRALLEFRSLPDLHKSRGIEGLRLALNLAFYESLGQKDYNLQLMLYHAHQECLDTATGGCEAVITAFVGISRLLFATEICLAEAIAGWNRLEKIAHAQSTDPPSSSKDFGEVNCHAFAEIARIVFGSRPLEAPIDPPANETDALLMRLAVGTAPKPAEFSHALDQLCALSERLENQSVVSVGTKLWGTVPASKTPGLHGKLKAGTLEFRDFWEHIRSERLPQETQERQVRAHSVSRSNVALLGILRNLPLDFLEEVRDSTFRDNVCAVLCRLIHSVQNIGFAETVVYDLLCRSKCAKSASMALHLGIWLDRIGNYAPPKDFMISLIDSLYPMTAEANFMDSTISKEAIYTHCIDLMRGAIEAGMQVIRVADNTDWGKAAARDWQELDKVLRAVKDIQPGLVPQPTWKRCLTRYDLHKKKCSKCVAGNACEKGCALHKNAQRQLHTLHSLHCRRQQIEIECMIPSLRDSAPEIPDWSPDTSDVHQKIAEAERSLPTDLPSVTRPSSKFPIRLGRGHTCASRCERFILGELTTTSIRFV